MIEITEDYKVWSVRTPNIYAVVGIDEFKKINSLLCEETKASLVLISITEPDMLGFDSGELDGYFDLLSVKFWDLKKPIKKDDEILDVISDEVATEIREFILKNSDKEFLIHCKAGISRSAGVAMAIESLLNGSFDLKNTPMYEMIKNSAIYSHERYDVNLTVYEKIIKG